MSWIVIAGNPVDGFTYYGPFAESNEANEYAEQHCEDTEFWLISLVTPQIEQTPYEAPLRPLNFNRCSCGHTWEVHQQNIHRLWVCGVCSCRSQIGPAT